MDQNPKENFLNITLWRLSSNYKTSPYTSGEEDYDPVRLMCYVLSVDFLLAAPQHYEPIFEKRT